MTVAHAAEPVAVETAVHRLAPECKVAAMAVFVVAVALVPQGSFGPYAVDLAVLVVVAAWARVSPGFLAARVAIEIPFVVFVVLLPFISDGHQVSVLGIGMSEHGLTVAGGIAAKATLAVLATGVLAATTPMPEIVAGMQRLRVPRTLTAIAGFAVRYLQVVMDELRRLQVARVARGDDARWLWQARTVTRTAGTLAVRCFERGERVHTSMLARGFHGRMPDVGMTPPAVAVAWLFAALPVVPAVAALLASRGRL
ncbi:MAG: cobalt ECF transporter T component CbiQ [Thermoleophilaceae bacterium]